MAAWMLYTVAVGCVLGLAGLLVERGLRHLGRPARWAWAGVMVLTLALPLALALTGHGSRWAVSSAPALWTRLPGQVGSVGADVGLLVVWIVVTLSLLANVRLSAWTVRRNERSWRSGRIGAHSLLVSSSFGPGVVGAMRPRIVLPEWVLGAASPVRRLIVMHEIEHVRARDTRLLLGGVILVTLVPWCVPLWWQLHRLRQAMELDCDARVLASAASPGQYARALVEVAGRPARARLPVPALAPRGGELERRIRFITTGPRDRSRRAGLVFLALAAAVILVLLAGPTPAPPSLVAVTSRPASEVPGAATVIISVAGEEPGIGARGR